MVFLGTPHHGSNLANLLNKLLAASMIGPSPKQYITDLAEDSPAIEDLNEQFRNVSGDLKIASFYETRYMFPGYKKLVRSLIDGVMVALTVVDCRQEFFRPWMPRRSTRLEKDDIKFLWHKLFIEALGQFKIDYPLYVVVDGLDECDSPQTLLGLFSLLPAHHSLRLIFTSRPTPALSIAFDKFSKSKPVTSIFSASNERDISMFVEKELQLMHGSLVLRRQVVDQVIQRASGNFLWVHLAVQEVLGCHTQDEIEHVLQDILPGMHLLYQRIEDGMAKNLKKTDQRLAKTLLTWVACSQRPLTLDELCKALEPDFPHLIDLQHTINQVCGNLLAIDRISRVTLIHQTAREYLIRISTGPFCVDPSQGQELLFLRCLSYLCDPLLRCQVEQSQPPVLLSYAANSWPFHLRAQSAESQEVIDALSNFLQNSSVLIWIKALAMQNSLKVLVQSSQALIAFSEKRRLLDSAVAPNLRPLRALESIELWSTDLVKIMGKFGRNLINTPEAIFKFVPQFCPRNSAIHQQFGRKRAFSVNVSGASYDKWDDNLAKLFAGAGSQALNVTCAGRYFWALTTSNFIIQWDSATCQEIRRLFHGEHVTVLAASSDGNNIASYGFRTTKVWDVSTGHEVCSISNPIDTRALSLAFVTGDTILLAGSDDKVI
ncbi:MAG: hypothetical protein Q9160_006724 [Pyrenula sp. 1 TL-2023]